MNTIILVSFGGFLIGASPLIVAMIIYTVITNSEELKIAHSQKIANDNRVRANKLNRDREHQRKVANEQSQRKAMELAKDSGMLKHIPSMSVFETGRFLDDYTAKLQKYTTQNPTTSLTAADINSHHRKAAIVLADLMKYSDEVNKAVSVAAKAAAQKAFKALYNPNGNTLYNHSQRGIGTPILRPLPKKELYPIAQQMLANKRIFTAVVKVQVPPIPNEAILTALNLTSVSPNKNSREHEYIYRHSKTTMCEVFAIVLQKTREKLLEKSGSKALLTDGFTYHQETKGLSGKKYREFMRLYRMDRRQMTQSEKDTYSDLSNEYWTKVNPDGEAEALAGYLLEQKIAYV